MRRRWLTTTLDSDNTITLANMMVMTFLAAGATDGLTDVGFSALTYSGFIYYKLGWFAVQIEAGSIKNGYGDTTTVATGNHTDLETWGFMEKQIML